MRLHALFNDNFEATVGGLTFVAKVGRSAILIIWSFERQPGLLRCAVAGGSCLIASAFSMQLQSC